MSKIGRKKFLQKIFWIFFDFFFCENFFHPILLKFGMHHYLGEIMKNSKKKIIFIEKYVIPDHQIFNRWSKKNFDKKFDAVWVPKNSISIIKLQKKWQKNFKNLFMKWGLVKLDFLDLIFWTPPTSAFTLWVTFLWYKNFYSTPLPAYCE